MMPGSRKSFHLRAGRWRGRLECIDNKLVVAWVMKCFGYSKNMCGTILLRLIFAVFSNSRDSSVTCLKNSCD